MCVWCEVYMLFDLLANVDLSSLDLQFALVGFDDLIAGLLIAGVTALVTGGISAASTAATNVQNQANADRDFNYNQQMNDLSMARADTAIERQAADAAAVGINPLAMNGTPVQANVVSQNNNPNLQAFHAPDLANSISSMIGTISQSKVNGAQVDLLNAEKANYTADTVKKNLENQYFVQELQDRLANSEADRRSKNALSDYQEWLNQQAKDHFNSETGQNYFMSDAEKAYTRFSKDFPDADSMGMFTDAEYKRAKAGILGAKGDDSLVGLLKSVLVDANTGTNKSATGRVFNGLRSVLNPQGISSDGDYYGSLMRNAESKRKKSKSRK